MRSSTTSIHATEVGAVALGTGIAVVLVLTVFAQPGSTSDMNPNSWKCFPPRVRNQTSFTATQQEERCVAMNSTVYLDEARSLPSNRVLVFNSIFTLSDRSGIVSQNVVFTIYDSMGSFDCSGTSYGNFVVTENASGTAVVGSSYQAPLPCA